MNTPNTRQMVADHFNVDINDVIDRKFDWSHDCGAREYRLYVFNDCRYSVARINPKKNSEVWEVVAEVAGGRKIWKWMK